MRWRARRWEGHHAPSTAFPTNERAIQLSPATHAPSTTTPASPTHTPRKVQEFAVPYFFGGSLTNSQCCMSRARGTTDIADVLPSSAVAAHPAARSGVISIHRATSLSSRSVPCSFPLHSSSRSRRQNYLLLIMMMVIITVLISMKVATSLSQSRVGSLLPPLMY